MHPFCGASHVPVPDVQQKGSSPFDTRTCDGSGHLTPSETRARSLRGAAERVRGPIVSTGVVYVVAYMQERGSAPESSSLRATEPPRGLRIC